MDLGQFAKRVRATASAHGFDTKDIPTRLALIHSEVSEALECYRDGHMTTTLDTEKDDKPEGFATELADIIIRVLDLAEAEGINIERDLLEKADYNDRRPFKHGGKRC